VEAIEASRCLSRLLVSKCILADQAPVTHRRWAGCSPRFQIQISKPVRKRRREEHEEMSSTKSNMNLGEHRHLRPSDDSVAAWTQCIGNRFWLPVLMIAACFTAAAVPVSGQRIVVFDVPGAVNTHPWGINNRGVVDGFYSGADGINRGFLRTPDGEFITFDGGTGASAPLGTFPAGINFLGSVTGAYDKDNVSHGFVRTRDGKVINFDVDGAGASGTLQPFGWCGGWTYPNCLQGTIPTSINDLGEIDGFFVDSNWVWHGFIREPDGRITKFDAPGASTLPGQGTAVNDQGPSLNNNGEIVGFSFGGQSADHGFIRTRAGKFIPFNDPNAATGQGTTPLSVNMFGLVAGDSIDSDGRRSFVGFRGDELNTYSAPGGPWPKWIYTQQVNDRGAVTGIINDDVLSGIVHGYVRSLDGKMSVFDAGPLSSGACCWQGTQSFGINDSGVVEGLYTDDHWVGHGFVRYPEE